MAHIWGTEDGPELDLPIIHFPDSSRLTRVRQVGVMRDFITMIPRAYSTMVVKCSARGIIVRKFHIIRNPDGEPLHVVFDDGCMSPGSSRTIFNCELTSPVYFQAWQQDEGSFFIPWLHPNTTKKFNYLKICTGHDVIAALLVEGQADPYHDPLSVEPPPRDDQSLEAVRRRLRAGGGCWNTQCPLGVTYSGNATLFSPAPFKKFRCTSCQTAIYCGRECQVAHW